MENSKIRTHYGEKILEGKLPSGWNFLGNLKTKDLPPIGREGLVWAMENPLGTPRLEELARGKKRAVIITGDVTRPAQGEVALPLILNTLNKAGIADKDILLIMRGGTHQAPQNLPEAYRKKYGEEVVNRVKILYHNPDQDLTSLGQTKRGVPVEINKWVAEADLRVSFSAILPHVLAGYSRGGNDHLSGHGQAEDSYHGRYRWNPGP